MLENNLIIFDLFILSVSDKYNTDTDCSRTFLLFNDIIKNDDKKLK